LQVNTWLFFSACNVHMLGTFKVYKYMYIMFNLAYYCLFRSLLYLEGVGRYSIKDFIYLGERTASFLWLKGR